MTVILRFLKSNSVWETHPLTPFSNFRKSTRKLWLLKGMDIPFKSNVLADYKISEESMPKKHC